VSIHRRAAKRDVNEAQIVEVLRKRGFTVDRVSAPGFPDLVVSKRVHQGHFTLVEGGYVSPIVEPAAWFVEVKQPKGKLRASQLAWQEKWQGPKVIVLRSVEDALRFPETEGP
jgi:hypothetical protein